MRLQLSVILIFVAICSSAQFARIEDKDGYVNIRKQPDIKSEIIGKFTEEDIFWCLWPEGEWYQADFKRGTGYIHKSRVKFISDLQVIPKTKAQAYNVVFQKDSIKVEIIVKPFKESENKIDFRARGSEKDVIKVNGKETWGNIGTMPHSEYQLVNYSFGKKTADLPNGEIANLFNPSLDQTNVNFDKSTATLYISANNSDGAGAYALIWIIKEGKYWKKELRIPF